MLQPRPPPPPPPHSLQGAVRWERDPGNEVATHLKKWIWYLAMLTVWWPPRQEVYGLWFITWLYLLTVWWDSLRPQSLPSLPSSQADQTVKAGLHNQDLVVDVSAVIQGKGTIVLTSDCSILQTGETGIILKFVFTMSKYVKLTVGKNIECHLIIMWKCIKVKVS